MNGIWWQGYLSLLNIVNLWYIRIPAIFHTPIMCQALYWFFTRHISLNIQNNVNKEDYNFPIVWWRNRHREVKLMMVDWDLKPFPHITFPLFWSLSHLKVGTGFVIILDIFEHLRITSCNKILGPVVMAGLEHAFPGAQDARSSSPHPPPPLS